MADIGHLDGSAAALAQRLRSLHPTLGLSDDDLLAAYWRFHPRFRFFKTVSAGAAVLDIGAGQGGLPAWRSWLDPVRADIRLFAVDRAPGPKGHLYVGWETIDLDTALPEFPGVTFDAAMLSHVIEHLSDPRRLIDWLATRLRPGGRVYLEWPSEASARQPGREALLALGIDIVITNFFDDATHRRLVPPAEIRAALQDVGFTCVGAGTIDLGLVGEEMMARGLWRENAFSRLAGFWSMTGWSTWIEAVRAGA